MRTAYESRNLTTEFGDSRSFRRFQLIIQALESDLNSTIPQAIKTQKGIKAAYRFFDNKHVFPEMMIKSHWDLVLPQVQSGAHKRLLQVSDTVEFDYSKKRARHALGPLNYQFRRGIRMHNSLIISGMNVPFGILHQSHHLRKDEEFGQAALRQSDPFEEKESFRWYEHFVKGQTLCEQTSDLEVVYVADREADIMELFLARSCSRMHFVIRSKHKRKLADKSGNLQWKLSSLDPKGSYQVTVYDPQTLKARIATVELRYCKASLKLHKELPRKRHLSGVDLYAVEAKEINPPANISEPIHWILLTTLPVETFDDAMLIIQYYSNRWIIERFHFLLKSGGADVEDLQLETSHRIQNALTLYSVAAFNVFKIRYLAENQPNIPIYDAGISQVEHKVLYEYAHKKISNRITFSPEKQPTILEFSVVLGQIGGFIPSKRQPVPGLKILSRAVELLHNLVDAYLLFCQRTE